MSTSRGNVYERQVLAALSAVKTSDPERLAVLDALDQLLPALKAADTDEQRLRERWAALDARAPDYPALAANLAADRSTVERDRLLALAGFHHTVATTLDSTQWQQWSAIMSADGAAYREPGFGGSGGRRPR